MASRSIVAASLLACLTSSISFGKERPRWIDPPPDLSASVAPSAETMPMMPYDQDVEATGSIQMPLEGSAISLREVPNAPRAQLARRELTPCSPDRRSAFIVAALQDRALPQRRQRDLRERRSMYLQGASLKTSWSASQRPISSTGTA
jgi:hypothetical protein